MQIVMNALLPSRRLAQIGLIGVASLALIGCNQSPNTAATTPDSQTASALANQATTPEATVNAASATSTNTAAGTPDPNKPQIVIGTTVGDFGDMVKNSIEPQLTQQGYKIKLVEFSDYVRPNQALADGDIDINVFQHKPYLDTFKKQHNLDLIEVFQVPTAPLGLYGGKLTALDQAKDGMTVAVPNDPSNFARALVMLGEMGWITLKDHIDPLTAAKSDIANNPKNIKLVELEAAQLPRSRQDVDFAIINGNYATSSGIKLTEALFQEPSYAYVNWAAIRQQDKDQPWVRDVTNAYNSDAFKQYAHQTFVGYKYPAIWNNQPQGAAPAASTSP